MRDLSPEKAVLASLRATLGLPSPSAGAGDGEVAVDWPAWLACAERHRLEPWFYHSAPASLRAAWPEPVAARLRAAAEFTLRRSLIAAAVQNRLLAQFEAAGIPVLVVKGLVLAEQIYGGLGRRHVGDIDLLTRPSEVERADRLLQAAGWRRTRPDFELTPRQLKSFMSVKPEFEYRQESPPVRLELLWRLEQLAEWGGSLGLEVERIECRVAGRQVQTLAPELNALYLAQHGARHGWFRLFWLVDFALVLRDSRIDWTRVRERAEAVGAGRALLQAAFLAESWLGVSVPDALRPAPADRAMIASLAAEAWRQVEGPGGRTSPLVEWGRQLHYRTRLQPGLRRKMDVLAPHFFSPLSWRTLALPDRWFFLYYPATPFLWLIRLIDRSVRSKLRSRRAKIAQFANGQSPSVPKH